jgi:hypothetical protein
MGESSSTAREPQLSDALRRWFPLPNSVEQVRQNGDGGSKPPEKVKKQKVASYIAPVQPKTAFE